MSTHGHVTFYEPNKTRPIQCYTWHDGHTTEAIGDLISLPFRIFNKQKAASADWAQNKDDGIKEGYWVYNQTLYFAMRYFLDKELPLLRKTTPWTHEEVYDSWVSMIPLQTCSLAFATWFCQQRFNRWNVVPNKSWCSYPGPDFIVLSTDKRINSYTIVYEADKDYIQEIEEEFKEKIAEKNALLPLSEFIWKNERIEEIIPCHITLNRIGNEFQIHVPFDAIFCELFWQDVDRANQLIATNNVSQDPILEAFLERWK